MTNRSNALRRRYQFGSRADLQLVDPHRSRVRRHNSCQLRSAPPVCGGFDRRHLNGLDAAQSRGRWLGRQSLLQMRIAPPLPRSGPAEHVRRRLFQCTAHRVAPLRALDSKLANQVGKLLGLL